MKATEVRIRKVRTEDVERIIEIERSWQHLSHWSEDSYYRLVREQGPTLSRLAELQDPDGALLITGFVIFHMVADSCEIYNLAVDRSHARSGIGSHLMNAVIQEAGKQQATRVLLEVRKSNAGAIRFYERFAFSTIGERRSYYSNPVEDAFVMERPVRLLS